MNLFILCMLLSLGFLTMSSPLPGTLDAEDIRDVQSKVDDESARLAATLSDSAKLNGEFLGQRSIWGMVDTTPPFS